MSAFGVKPTWRMRCEMSAFDQATRVDISTRIDIRLTPPMAVEE